MALLDPTSSDSTPAPASRIAAVIWDYDGTLVESRFADEAAVAEIVAADPAAAAGAEAFWAMEGMPIEKRIALAWPGHLDDYLAIFEKPVAPRVFPGIPETLQALASRGVPMAVVSSRRRQGLEWGLEITGLAPYFRRVIGLDDVSQPKPSPEGLLLALRSLEADPSAAVYIGDSEFDIEAAENAAMTGWRATWTHDQPVDAANGVLLRRPQDVLSRLGDTARRLKWLTEAPESRVLPLRDEGTG